MIRKSLSGLLLACGIGLCGWTPSANADEPAGEGHAPRLGLLPDGPGAPELTLPRGPVVGPGPGAGPAGPAREVIQILSEIEHLYREQGRTRKVIALYQDVLRRTKDPQVRHFAYEAMAHAQLQPADNDKAVTTLRQSLDESLQHLEQAPPADLQRKGM